MLTPSIGFEPPKLTKEPINRTTLALFAGASGDHNRIHIDSDFAKAAGQPDVFAQGMLVMAYVGQFLTNCWPQSALRSFGGRFVAITRLGDEISCRGKIVETFRLHGETRFRLAVEAIDQHGEVKLTGDAVFSANREGSAGPP